MHESIKVLSFNIKSGEGIDGRVDIQRIAAVLAMVNPDLVGLQEVDCFNPRSGFKHQAKFLSKVLGLDYVFKANCHWGWFTQFGNAILSTRSVVSHQHYLLPSARETRGLLGTQIIYGETKINFYNTHLGLNEAERLKHTNKILQVLKNSPLPTILVGDFNNGRSAPEHQLLVSNLTEATGINGGFNTFPADRPEEQLDFIFISPHWQVLKATAVLTQASDHLPVLVELTLK